MKIAWRLVTKMEALTDSGEIICVLSFVRVQFFRSLGLDDMQPIDPPDEFHPGLDGDIYYDMIPMAGECQVQVAIDHAVDMVAGNLYYQSLTPAPWGFIEGMVRAQMMEDSDGDD